MKMNCKKCGWEPTGDTFFIEHGKCFLKLYSYGEIDEFTVEGLYQGFKKRFLIEVEGPHHCPDCGESIEVKEAINGTPETD